jgi:hypothetical protein
MFDWLWITWLDELISVPLMFMSWFIGCACILPSLPVPLPKVPSLLPCILPRASRSFYEISFYTWYFPLDVAPCERSWCPRSPPLLSPDRWIFRLLEFKFATVGVMPVPVDPFLMNEPSTDLPWVDSPLEDFFLTCKLGSKSVDGFPNIYPPWASWLCVF